MRKHNFLEYIIQHSRENSPIGDFCNDTLRLIKMGKIPKSYTLTEIVRFMENNHACDEAIEACKEAWCEWKSVI